MTRQLSHRTTFEISDKASQLPSESSTLNLNNNMKCRGLVNISNRKMANHFTSPLNRNIHLSSGRKILKQAQIFARNKENRERHSLGAPANVPEKRLRRSVVHFSPT